MTDQRFPPLRLKKQEERRLRAGHLWVYSNEVDVSLTPLNEFEPGQGVEIQDFHGKILGTGYVNPHSLICARLVSRDKRHPLDGSLIVHRLKVALSLRERLYDRPFYRLVYGEGDGLPGLIVDRFAEFLVAQITTAGMERLKADVVAALVKVIRPSGILLRNDNPIRDREQLSRYLENVDGEIPQQIMVPEHGVDFMVSLHEGQKTGWFFDQFENRKWMYRLAPGKRVLDLFSYVGAWGVQAASAGACEAYCIDESSTALKLVEQNARHNEVNEKIVVQQADAFKALSSLVRAKERFDVAVLDPPAFIKRKKDLKAGVRAYRRLNELAMRVLNKDAILISCSCSYHLSLSDLVQQIQQSARHLDRTLQILGFGQQAPDHPIHPAIPETAYLKAVIVRVLT